MGHRKITSCLSNGIDKVVALLLQPTARVVTGSAHASLYAVMAEQHWIAAAPAAINSMHCWQMYLHAKGCANALHAWTGTHQTSLTTELNLHCCTTCCYMEPFGANAAHGATADYATVLGGPLQSNSTPSPLNPTALPATDGWSSAPNHAQRTAPRRHVMPSECCCCTCTYTT